MAFLSGWSYRKKITIDNTYVDSDLTDFPVLVKFTSDADIGANALSSGNDIRFTSSDGTTLLKYEREAFAVSGSASGTFWVKVPTVAGSADTEIYLYYGNSGASDGADKNNVWDSNYAAVWHLNESGNGTASEFTDSTSNARHGRGGDGTAGAVPTRATGQVEYGQDFDNSGTADYIGSMGSVSAFSFIQNTGVFTVELLLNGSGSTTTEQGVIGSTPTSGDKGIYLSWNASNLKRCDFFIARGGAGSSAATATNSVSSGAWHHVAFTGDASTIRSYIDGAAGATGSIGGTTTGDSTRVLNAGRWNGSTPGGYYDGLVDEIRISTVQRSAAWLKFVYRNIFEADNEISLGTAEAAPSAPQQPWVRLLLLQDDNYDPPASAATAAYSLTCDTGNLTLTGNATGLTVQRTLTAAQGSLTLTGNDATFQRGYTLTCGQGSLTLTGNDTGLAAQRTIAAATGNLTLTGFDVGLTAQRTLAAGQGSLTLAGQDGGLTVQRTLTCATGYLTLTGIDVTLTYTPNVGAYTLACATGYLTLAGQAVALDYVPIDTPTPTRSFGGGGSVGRKYRRGYERRKKLEELRKQFEEALREADKRAEEARKELEEARQEAQEATARAKEAQEQAGAIKRAAQDAEDRYRAALAEIHAETLADLAREEQERLAEIARREAEELEAAIEAARVKAELLRQFLEEAGGELEADARIEAEFARLLEWEKRRKARIRRRKRQRRMERMLRRPEERLLMSDAPLEEIEAKLIAWSELIASV